MKNCIRRFIFLVLAICFISCTALSGSVVAEPYPPGQLSTEDMNTFKDAYGDIRFDFDRYYLPHFALHEESSGLANSILKQDVAVVDWAHFVWTYWVAAALFDIQKGSAYSYQLPEQQVFDDLTQDEINQLISDYTSLIQEAGMSSYDQFDVSFKELAGNGMLMLLDFQNTDSQRACKYVGITAAEDGSRRYYFAESTAGYAVTDRFPEMADVFFCGEFISDEEANYWNAEATKAAFIESIHASLNGELEYMPIITIHFPEEW